MNTKIRVICFIGLAGILSGCAHQLEVRNLQTYRNRAIVPLEKFYVIGITSSADDNYSEGIVHAVGSSLAGNPTAAVIYPYPGAGTVTADIVANIAIDSEYKGSGWNFLINFPGFLVFAPAWNGYVYKAIYDVDIVLSRGSDRAQLDHWKMPVELDLRQAEPDRTWTEIGWLEVGVIPFVGGVFFTRYDPDVTPMLMARITKPIGDYIAREIVKRVNSPKGAPASTQPPSSPANTGSESFETAWRRLTRLKDNGTITHQEYTRQLDELMKRK